MRRGRVNSATLVLTGFKQEEEEAASLAWEWSD